MLTCLGYGGACVYVLPWSMSYRFTHSRDGRVWPLGTSAASSSLILYDSDKMQYYLRRDIGDGNALVFIISFLFPLTSTSYNYN
jgi:hypothetical protein